MIRVILVGGMLPVYGTRTLERTHHKLEVKHRRANWFPLSRHSQHFWCQGSDGGSKVTNATTVTTNCSTHRTVHNKITIGWHVWDGVLSVLTWPPNPRRWKRRPVGARSSRRSNTALAAELTLLFSRTISAWDDLTPEVFQAPSLWHLHSEDVKSTISS